MSGPTAYDLLMDRLLDSQTETALVEIVPAILTYVTLHPASQFDFAESWFQQWGAYVGDDKPVPAGLRPPSGTQ